MCQDIYLVNKHAWQFFFHSDSIHIAREGSEPIPAIPGRRWLSLWSSKRWRCGSWAHRCHFRSPFFAILRFCKQFLWICTKILDRSCENDNISQRWENLVQFVKNFLFRGQLWLLFFQSRGKVFSKIRSKCPNKF